MDYWGAMAVSITRGHLPGRDPHRSSGHPAGSLTSSRLRVDCVQTRPFLNLLAPAAWVALVSLYTDRAGKLPSLQTLAFQQPNGQYVMVPLEHADKRAEKLPQLEVNQGWLVDRTGKSNRPVDQKAFDTVPEVTYLKLQMKITPITPVTLQLASGSSGRDNGSWVGDKSDGRKSNDGTKGNG